MKYLSIIATSLALYSCSTGENPSAVSNESPSEKSAAAAPSGSKHSIIVDVRTIGEWESGHQDCTVNYPLDQLQGYEKELEKYDTVYFVCQSGNRAGSATSYMQSAHPDKVYINSGSWRDVACK